MLPLDNMLAKLIRPDIQALSAYSIPQPGNMTKLDAMENPYGWPQSLADKLHDQLKQAHINRYPDPEARELKDVLRNNMSIPDNMDIMLGNGSDEIIQIILMALSQTGRTVLSPSPSFVMYDMISTFTGLQYKAVPLADDFSLDMPNMLDALKTLDPAVTFISYPNNPTGNLFERRDIESILHHSNGLVVVDEAYHAFSDASFMQDLENHDNLLVMRTVSKMGLAGLRLGLLAGHEKWLREFNKIRLPYNINILTQITAAFALQNYDVFAAQTAAICSDRDDMLVKLGKMDGITAFPSNANFILFRAPADSATRIFNDLKNNGVLIKNLGAAQGLLKDCLRVTIGTPEENRLFLDTLSEII